MSCMRRKLALEEAVNVLGVLAKPQDIMEYVESHKNRNNAADRW